VKNKQQSVFSSNDYINTVSIPNLNKPEVLVTGDNKGFITLWDLSKISECMNNQIKPCENIILQQWPHNADIQNNIQSIYSVSISENSCYLASAGSDGRVVLWGVNNNRKKQLKEYFDSGADSQKARSVDIKRTVDSNSSQNIVLISTAQGNQVSVYRYQEQENDCK
jgi:WD40 repeat protein